MAEQVATCYETLLTLLIENEEKPIEIKVLNVDNTFPDGIRCQQEIEIACKVICYGVSLYHVCCQSQ